MRVTWPLLLAAVLAVLPCASLAQTTPQPGTATCTGSSVQPAGISMTLAIREGDSFREVPIANAGSVLDLAECMCDPPDLYVELKLTGFVAADLTALEVWVGAGCNTGTNRNTSSGAGVVCSRVSSQNGIDRFKQGGVVGTAPLFERIPVKNLMVPNGAACTASPTQASNGVYFLFSAGALSGDATNYCVLTLPSQTQVPVAPTLPDNSASGGSGAVTVRWNSPPAGTLQPVAYQVLCAQADGSFVPGKNGLRQYYSLCLDPDSTRTLRRQYVYTPTTYGGSSGGGDGGTGSGDAGTGDGGAGLVAEEGAQGGGFLAGDGSTDDAGEVDASDPGTSDGGTSSSCSPPPQGLLDLDPAYLCSGERFTGREARITGLQNDTYYQFLVVGIDNWGNATPVDAVTCANPQPVEDFFNRFRDRKGAPQGCFIATAAYGSYESPYVRTLRRFRDEVLLPNERGRAFVDWYYRYSPTAASYIAAHDLARGAVRMMLWPVIAMAWLWLTLGPAGLILLAVCCSAWAARRRLWHALALGDEGRAS